MTQPQSHDLEASFEDVRRARSALEQVRLRGPVQGAAPQQRQLWAALEKCAVALTSLGHPTPYRMQAELAMYRAMFDGPRHQGP